MAEDCPCAEVLQKSLDEMKVSLKEIDKMLRGNGKPGLNAQVAQNSRDLEGISWFKRAVIGSLAAIGIKTFFFGG